VRSQVSQLKSRFQVMEKDPVADGPRAHRMLRHQCNISENPGSAPGWVIDPFFWFVPLSFLFCGAFFRRCVAFHLSTNRLFTVNFCLHINNEYLPRPRLFVSEDTIDNEGRVFGLEGGLVRLPVYSTKHQGG